MSLHVEPIILKIRAIEGEPKRGSPFYAVCDVILLNSTAIIKGLHGDLTFKDTRDLFKILKENYNVKTIRYERNNVWIEKEI